MIWNKRTGLILLAPAVVWILAFTIFPLIQSLFYSFEKLRLGRPSKFAGLDNYERIFRDERVMEVLGTSFFLSFSGLLLTLSLGIGMAWLFSREFPGHRILRACMTMPLFTAPVAVAFAGVALFNEVDGPINKALMALGASGPVHWISDPWSARFAVLIADTWQWTPFAFIVILAAMQSIPDDLYEAARVETKSEWKVFRRVTLPLIMPAIATTAILRLIETFKILDIPLNLTAGGPGAATQTYSYYTFVTGLKSFNLGYGSALSWMLVLVCIVLTTFFFALQKRRYEAVS